MLLCFLRGESSCGCARGGSRVDCWVEISLSGKSASGVGSVLAILVAGGNLERDGFGKKEGGNQQTAAGEQTVVLDDHDLVRCVFEECVYMGCVEGRGWWK